MIPAGWPYSQHTYQAFTAITAAGFTHYCCGEPHAPHVLVSTYNWGNYLDIINIRGLHHTTAARLPQQPDLDFFAPSKTVWHYMGSLEPTVAALLRLPPPHHPDAPTTIYPAPLTLFVASHEQRPMTIKPGRPTTQKINT